VPKLDWIGRQAVVNHDREVPYHLLQCDAELSAGDPNSGNMLVQGDNLLALKALLPYYAGQVRCIYIDPPYNTGNENWVYNDNVNSPEMRAWLGSVVGGEGEDLSRHDKWLCMMYPRLRLLQRFLSRDGAIFVSIDDNEVHHLRMLMDEIFGPQNFVATIIWQKVYSPKNSARHFSEDHDYILVYANNAETWRPRLVPRTEKQDNAYRNPDGDVRGLWKPSGLDARNFYSLGTYPITCPGGRVIPGPPTGSYWRVSEEQFRKLDADNRIWWGKDKNAIPQIKRFLSEVKQGVVPQTLWTYDEVGHTQEAKQELVSTMSFENSGSVFVTPKPVRLIRRILQVATEPDSIVLDAFAGSGTTGVATLAANSADGGNRRFIPWRWTRRSAALLRRSVYAGSSTGIKVRSLAVRPKKWPDSAADSATAPWAPPCSTATTRSTARCPSLIWPATSTSSRQAGPCRTRTAVTRHLSECRKESPSTCSATAYYPIGIQAVKMPSPARLWRCCRPTMDRESSMAPPAA